MRIVGPIYSRGALLSRWSRAPGWGGCIIYYVRDMSHQFTYHGYYNAMMHDGVVPYIIKGPHPLPFYSYLYPYPGTISGWAPPLRFNSG